MNTINTFQFKEVSISIEGDYYQVMFHDGLDTDDEPYFMIQRQFEFSDGGVCYFESHKKDLIDQSRVKSASLSENKLRISYGRNPCRDVEVRFVVKDADYKRLASTLVEMIPEIAVRE